MYFLNRHDCPNNIFIYGNILKLMIHVLHIEMLDLKEHSKESKDNIVYEHSKIKSLLKQK
jgi:hypothetical protein